MMTAQMAGNNSRRGLEKIFHMYDTEERGRITPDILRRVSIEMGDELDEEEIRGMIEHASNGRGYVGIEDFCVFMSQRMDPNAALPPDDDDDDNEFNDFIQLGERVDYGV